MWKLLVSVLMCGVLSANMYAEHWRYYRPYYRGHRAPRYNSYHYNNGGRISPGAAAAIGIGAGVIGYVIARGSSKNNSDSNSRIECKEFDMKVMIDGEERKAKVTKCRTDGGNWQIPE